MARSALTSELRLDPGSARRKSRLGFSTILKALFALACLWAVYFVTKTMYSNISYYRAPHDSLYQDLDVPFKQSDVVRPLLDVDQTFSVVATVWIRDNAASSGPAELNSTNELPVEGGPILHERVLFSDTIFRDLRLTTAVKDVKRVVDLKIPTAVFQNAELWTYDLRASFVVIPDSPSLLDHADNYSSWIPSGVNYPPVRPWEDGHLPSMKERIIDSYGTFIPLVEFMTVNSTCLNTKAGNGTAKSHLAVDAQEGIDDDSQVDDMEIPVVETDTGHSPHFGPGYASTRRKSATEAHPYIITRSHLRVVDMVRLYNRTAYEQHHLKLRLESCGQRFMTDTLDWRMCWKHFSVNANSETRVKLRRKTSENQKISTEWAYAPYVSMSESAWGPLDLVKVPVNREVCEEPVPANQRNYGTEEGYLSIKWNVAFSVRTPGQLFFADTSGMVVSAFNNVASLETEADREKVHSKFEYANGLHGHRFNENSHPRRHSILYGINGFVSFISGVLTFHYWYTRASTVGISKQGNALIACASLVHLILKTVLENTKAKSVFAWIFVVLWQFPFSLVPLFTLKALTRIDIEWQKYWVPTASIAPASHLERASERIEARIKWLYKALTFSALAAVFSYASAFYFFGPSLQTAEFDKPNAVLATTQSLLLFPATTLGYALQLYLNLTSNSFAGTYRLCTPLYVLQDILTAARALPLVVGGLSSAKGISVFITMKLFLDVALAYQALIYSPVSHLEEEDDSSR